jgi:hypothetical protein
MVQPTAQNRHWPTGKDFTEEGRARTVSVCEMPAAAAAADMALILRKSRLLSFIIASLVLSRAHGARSLEV